MSTGRSTAAPLRAIVPITVAALLLAGCSAGPIDELTLRVATLLPLTATVVDEEAEPAEGEAPPTVTVPTTGFGPAAEAGVALAVQEINAAGLRVTIEPSYADSGDAASGAWKSAVPGLAAADVVIGPADAAIAEALLPQLGESGVLVISPGDTSSASEGWADAGLYWRTAAPGLIQATGIADLLPLGSVTNLVVIAVNDDEHKELATAITNSVAAKGSRVLTSVGLDTESGLLFGVADEALRWRSDGIVLLAAPEQTGPMLDILIGAGYPADQITLVDENLVSYADAGLQHKLEGVQGVAPRAQLSAEREAALREAYAALHPEAFAADPTLAVLGDLHGAAEAYDAVVVAALGAMAARSTDGAAIAGKLREITGTRDGATTCTGFAQCAQLLIDGAAIDYDGATGGIAFGADRAPSEFTMPVFVYDAANAFAVLVGEGDGEGGEGEEGEEEGVPADEA